MTLDERFEKLAERHEALAQSLEFMAGMQRDHEQRMRQAIETLTSLHADNEHRMARMMEAIGRLSRIAANHEDRISDLEE